MLRDRAHAVTSLPHGLIPRNCTRDYRQAMMENDPVDSSVVLEFPTVEEAKSWYKFTEYAPLKAMRRAAATSTVFIVESWPEGLYLPSANDTAVVIVQIKSGWSGASLRRSCLGCRSVIADRFLWCGEVITLERPATCAALVLCVAILVSDLLPGIRGSQ